MANRRRGPQRGTGTQYADTGFEKIKGQAEKLGSVNSMAPAVCIFQYSPRRWGYGIRFYPKGGAKIEHFKDGLVVTPVWQEGRILTLRPRRRG